MVIDVWKLTLLMYVLSVFSGGKNSIIVSYFDLNSTFHLYDSASVLLNIHII